MNHLASDRWILRKINEHFDDTLEKDGKGILRIRQLVGLYRGLYYPVII